MSVAEPTHVRDLRPQPKDSMPQMVISAADYEKRTNELRQFVREQMVEGVDFGCIPGTPKATLYKPGAEKLLAIFGFATRFETTHRIEALCDEKPFCLYEVRVLVVNKKTGGIEAEGLGACNSKENRYAKRPTPEIANTVLKMAKKRAFIDATVIATRTGALFSSNDLKETNNSTPAVEPEPEPAAPQMALVASRQELRFAENMRARAVALGYKTEAGTEPKPIADGEKRTIVKAKAQKWQKFVEENELAAQAPKPQATEESEARKGKGPRYNIPKYTPARNCTSCGANIWFVKTGAGKTVPVTSDGYSHFETCPNAGQHSQKPTQPGWLKHLFAVANANKLDLGPDTREERILNGNKILLDHEFDVVESWNQLGKARAECLSGAIDAKIYTWGTPQVAEVGEAA